MSAVKHSDASQPASGNAGGPQTGQQNRQYDTHEQLKPALKVDIQPKPTSDAATSPFSDAAQSLSPTPLSQAKDLLSKVENLTYRFHK